MRVFQKTWVIILAVTLVLVAGLAGFRAIRASARRARAAASAYSTATVTRGSLEVTVTGTGTLAPKAHQDCFVSAGGKVTSVPVEPGQTVEAGQVLVVLSNDDLADQVTQARLELRLAQMDLDALTKSGAGQGTAADVDAAQSAVVNARLARDRAQENVDKLAVEAPFAGRVSGLAFGPGDEVPAGTTLLSLASSDQLKAVLSVPEDELKHLALGQPVTVTVSPLGQDLSGHITAVGSQGSAGARGVFYSVTVGLDDSDDRARGGMTVSADLDTGGSWPSDTITVTGTLAYDRYEPIVTPTGGTVSTVSVSEDQVVAQGHVLLTLTSAEAVAALAGAEADYERTEERLAQLTDPGSSSYPASQVEKAQVRYEETALKLAGLERQLAELTVKAEIAGTVTEIAYSIGERVPPNQRVAAVADLSSVEAVVTVDELQVARLAVGQAATIRIDALPGESFAGTLDSLSLEGTPRDGVTAYEARVNFPGDTRMRSGMSLSTTIEVARRENALLVPVEAVYGAGREASVQVLVNGKPEARPVVAGLSNTTYTEIIEGLAEGETVITGSLQTDDSLFGGMGPPGHGGGSGGSQQPDTGGDTGGDAGGGG